MQLDEAVHILCTAFDHLGNVGQIIVSLTRSGYDQVDFPALISHHSGFHWWRDIHTYKWGKDIYQLNVPISILKFLQKAEGYFVIRSQ